MKICDMCPFVKDCATCPNQGGVSVVAQEDSTRFGCRIGSGPEVRQHPEADDHSTLERDVIAMSDITPPTPAREPFADIDAARERRVEAAKRTHATMLSRTDSAGRPLYRVTSGGNIVRTRPITQRLKAKILKRDGYACVECHASPEILHVAHIEDYRINGNNDLENLRTLCPNCHAAETVTDWTRTAGAQRAAWDRYVSEAI